MIESKEERIAIYAGHPGKKEKKSSHKTISTIFQMGANNRKQNFHAVPPDFGRLGLLLGSILGMKLYSATNFDRESFSSTFSCLTFAFLASLLIFLTLYF